MRMQTRHYFICFNCCERPKATSWTRLIRCSPTSLKFEIWRSAESLVRRMASSRCSSYRPNQSRNFWPKKIRSAPSSEPMRGKSSGQLRILGWTKIGMFQLFTESGSTGRVSSCSSSTHFLLFVEKSGLVGDCGPNPPTRKPVERTFGRFLLFFHLLPWAGHLPGCILGVARPM